MLQKGTMPCVAISTCSAEKAANPSTGAGKAKDSGKDSTSQLSGAPGDEWRMRMTPKREPTQMRPAWSSNSDNTCSRTSPWRNGL